MSIHPVFQVINRYLEQHPHHHETLLPDVETAFMHIQWTVLHNFQYEEDLNLLARNFSLPTTHEFEYLVEDSGWILFQLRDVLGNRNGLGVILAKTPWQETTAVPPPFCHHSILHPTNQFQIRSEGEPILRGALIYPEFTLLMTYRERNLQSSCDITAVQGTFQPFIRSYVFGLLNLYKDGCYNGQIELSSLITVGSEGMFLCPSTLRNPSTTVDDFKSLGKALKKLATERAWRLEIAGSISRANPLGIPYHGLGRLIDYLISRIFSTREHCAWLEYFPYVLNDDEKINDFIPQIFYIADKIGQFRSNLKMKTLLWRARIASFLTQHNELNEVYKHNGAASRWVDTYYDFFLFLRNCVAHLHGHVSKSGQSRNEYSLLLRDTSVFIRIIHNIDPNFFDEIWTEAVVIARLNCVVKNIHRRIH